MLAIMLVIMPLNNVSNNFGGKSLNNVGDNAGNNAGDNAFE